MVRTWKGPRYHTLDSLHRSGQTKNSQEKRQQSNKLYIPLMFVTTDQSIVTVCLTDFIYHTRSMDSYFSFPKILAYTKCYILNYYY